jgi:hypothetical protein
MSLGSRKRRRGTEEPVPDHCVDHRLVALHQFGGGLSAAAHPHSFALNQAAPAEFAPDPALDPLGVSYWEPFHGAIKKDFGFQITLKVSPEERKENGTSGKEKDKGGKEESETTGSRA